MKINGREVTNAAEFHKVFDEIMDTYDKNTNDVFHLFSSDREQFNEFKRLYKDNYNNYENLCHLFNEVGNNSYILQTIGVEKLKLEEDDLKETLSNTRLRLEMLKRTESYNNDWKSKSNYEKRFSSFAPEEEVHIDSFLWLGPVLFKLFMASVVIEIVVDLVNNFLFIITNPLYLIMFSLAVFFIIVGLKNRCKYKIIYVFNDALNTGNYSTIIKSLCSYLMIVMGFIIIVLMILYGKKITFAELLLFSLSFLPIFKWIIIISVIIMTIIFIKRITK